MVDCGHEIKRHFLLGRKVMTNLDSILKSRDVTLPTKVLSSESYGFSSSPITDVRVQLQRRLSAKELMLSNWGTGEWRRLLRVPWTARRSNQSILKEINPEYSLERLMLKLTLQYFGHLIRTANLLEKTLMLGRSEGERGREQQRIR